MDPHFPRLPANSCLPVVFGLLALACGPRPAAGQPPATTVQLPTFGVAVDAEGVLSVKTFTDPTGQLQAERLRAVAAQRAPNLAARSRLRKVSLVRLEAAIRKRLDQGQNLDDAMRYLAGLQRLEYVFFYPASKEIVIAGPAEGFMADLAGRVRGITTGRPVLELEDLAVALRALSPERPGAAPFIGCTIDPTPEAMRRLQEFQRTVPHSVPEARRAELGQQIAQGLRESLGMAPIRVFGVPPDTHFAQVLVEADYRMKLIGLGLEPPPVRISSYLDLLGGGSIRQGALQRWWFTPNYDCVKTTSDRLGMELVGQGVQLQTESKLIGADGQLSWGAPSNKASETFAAGFTRKYPEIADRSPVYAQLRNLIDMLVAAAFLRGEDYAGRAGWTMPVLGREAVLPVRTQKAPTQAACAVNAAWKGSRFISVAGGGVSIRPQEALAPGRLAADEDGRLGQIRSQATERAAAGAWWWD
jgi:hypothetical protein